MGIQINGNNDIISALDGSWTAEGASINTSGILTATTFKGNVTGTACTFVDGKFTGNVTIGGTLTYEDVTNIDSVGLITARGGIDCNGDIDVDGHTNLDNVSVAGVTTITGTSGNLLNVNHTGGSGAQGVIRTKATDANSSSFLRAEDSGATYIGLLKYGTGHSAYGALGAGDGALYANSGGGNDTNITIMADSSTGYINFATGGNTERLRISSSGYMQMKNSAGSTFALLRNTAVADSSSLLGGIDFGTIDWDSSCAAVKSYQDGAKDKASLRFYTQAAVGPGIQERLRIDSKGQMGLGVTPNANWPSNGDFKALQLGTGIAVFGRGSGDEDRGGIAANYYHTGSATKYIGNGHAGRMYFEDGSIVFSNAAQNSSGANAALTLIERLKIASDGTIFINRDANGGRLYATGGNLYLQDGNGRQTFRVDAMASGTRTSVLTGGGCLSIGTANPNQPNVPGIHIESDESDDCRIAFVTTNKANTRIGYFGLSNRFGIDMHNGFQIRDAGQSYATRLLVSYHGQLLQGTESQDQGWAVFARSAGSGADAGTAGQDGAGDKGVNIRADMGPTHTDLTGVDNWTLKLHNAAYAGTGVSNPQGSIAKILFNTGTYNGWNAYGAIALDTQGAGGARGELTFMTNSGTSIMSEKLRIRSDGRVHMGVSSPTTSDAGADDLVIGNTTDGVNRGLTIWSHTSQNGNVAFADNDANFRGAVQYIHGDDQMRFVVTGEEKFRITEHGTYNTPITGGDSVNTKSGGRFYTISGATPLDGTNTNQTETPLMRCGHSFNGTMRIWMAFSGSEFHNGCRQMTVDCQGTYGYVDLEEESAYNQNALGAGLNSLVFQYQNTGSPNYYFKVKGTWASGQNTPYILWSWTGHNSEYPYAL